MTLRGREARGEAARLLHEIGTEGPRLGGRAGFAKRLHGEGHRRVLGVSRRAGDMQHSVGLTQSVPAKTKPYLDSHSPPACNFPNPFAFPFQWLLSCRLPWRARPLSQMLNSPLPPGDV